MGERLTDMSIEEYVKWWDGNEYPKPEGEPNYFIDLFIAWFSEIKEPIDRISFDGEGSYFGKQFTVVDCPWRANLMFEVSYSPTTISIYTARHNGFWVAEYAKIETDHPKFHELLRLIQDKLVLLVVVMPLLLPPHETKEEEN